MMDTGNTTESATKATFESLGIPASERAQQKLAAVEGLNLALFQEQDMVQFASTTLDYAFSIIGGQAGSLLLASRENKNLEFFLSKGPKSVPRWTKVGWHLGIAGYVFHSGKSEFVSDALRDPRHLQEIDRLTGYTTKNLIATPIKNPDGDSMGVVEILNVSQGPPSEEDTVFLQILASFISIGLHRNWPNQNIQKEAVDNFVKDRIHTMKNLLQPILDGKEFLKEELLEIFGSLPRQKAIHLQPAIGTCRESLDLIDRNSKRLQKNAKDLLDCLMGRIAIHQSTSCSIHTVTREVLDALAIPIQKLSLTIESQGLDDLPPIPADERKLFSVFYNLLHNAVTALRKGDTIGIHGYRDGDHIRLTIRDNGPGISQDEINVLFSTKKGSKKSLGNGLGMKCVRNAVEEHGGFIKVESMRGVGTTIHISLPVQGTSGSANLESPDAQRDRDKSTASD